MRFMFHANCLDVGNILNQFGIWSDERAEAWNKKHCIKAFECIPFMSKKDMIEMGKKVRD